MDLFFSPLDIAEDEGFSAEKDLFGRKTIADSMTALLTNVDQPLVLALDGQWGSGKTTFLKMWKGELRKLGVPVIYFDAFAHDYFEDAFIPLAAEIVALAQKKLLDDQSQVEAFTKSAVKVGKVLLRSGLKIAVKAATLNTLDTSDVELSIANESEALFDKHVGELITKQAKTKSEMDAFRDALAALPKLLASTTLDNATHIPLVIIVDELDRCRPQYALQLIERMKHFFSVPNTHFVLGTNLTQLSNSVKATYGAGIDAETYLQKFVHFSVTLPSIETRQNKHVSNIFINHLASRYNFGTDEKKRFIDECFEHLIRIANKIGPSLREIEKIVSLMVHATLSIPTNQFKNSSLTSGLAILKILHPKLFLFAKHGKLDYSEVANAFRLLDSAALSNVANNTDITIALSEQREFEWWWRYATQRDCPDEILVQIDRFLLRYHFQDRFHVFEYVTNNQFDTFKFV